jgi:uncharacterized protein (TIGR02145 family)
MKKYLIILLFAFLLFNCKKDDNSSNPNNNNYETVTIGTQVWMKKNLNVDYYRNGDPIHQVTDSTQWSNLKTGAWCYYNNDPALGAIYGKLYNWYAVKDPRGLAPDGWHVPNKEEWSELVDYLGGDSVAGCKLKEKGTEHWKSPNSDATNESGFSALPGGGCYNGMFDDIKWSCNFWTSSLCVGTLGVYYELVFEGKRIRWDCMGSKIGYSVRCIKDK